MAHSSSPQERAIAYSPIVRLTAAVLVALSRGSMLFLGALLFSQMELGNYLRLTRWFAVLCIVPEIAAWLIARVSATTLIIEGGALVLETSSRRIEIPLESIDRVAPWVVPLPALGLSLHLKSGRVFGYGLQVANPVSLIEGLVDAGAPEQVRVASQHPLVLYARSKSAAADRWYRPLLKFVIFGLVPTLPLFRLHQWVAYGATFGEYYSYGLRAYLLAFAIYWSAYIVHLVLYAAALRAVAEPLVLAAAFLAPSSAPAVRRIAEMALRIFYYGGVLLFLIRFFM